MDSLLADEPIDSLLKSEAVLMLTAIIAPASVYYTYSGNKKRVLPAFNDYS